MGGTDGIRQKILTLIYSFNKEVEDGIKTWLAPPPPLPPRKKQKSSHDDQRVAVVEPDEALDVL